MAFTIKNPFASKSQEKLQMTIDQYGHLLSAKTQALLALDAQKRDLEAKESRKQKLIAAIGEASTQIDLTDDEAQQIQAQITEAERELSELEKSLSSEAKKLYKQAEQVLGNRIELCRKYNQAIRDVEALWEEITGDLSQSEEIAFRTAFNQRHPLADHGSYIINDVNFSGLPEFVKYEGQNTIATQKRSDRHPNAL